MERALQGMAVFVALAGAAIAQAPSSAVPPPVRRGPAPLADTQGPKVRIVAYDHGDVSPWIEFFAFDSPKHPKIVQLRSEYKLNDVVAGAKTDLERAIKLKNWTARALKFGTPAPDVFSDWSAVALLERAKKGQVVWCGQAAMVFQQACLAMGVPARFLELGRPENPACHFTTEVYLREHSKWAVIDATPLPAFDLYYTVDGVPQTALEMHNHVVRGTMAQVREVHPDRTVAVESKASPAWAFYYLRWLTRCDVVTNTPKYHDQENVFDKRWQTVEWADERTVPWEKQKHAAWFVRNERLAAWNTSDPDVVYWAPTERVRMLVCPSEEGRVYVQLWTGDGEFDHYQARIDGQSWEDLPKANVYDTGRRHGWGLRRLSMAATPGTHDVRVRVVCKDGSTGPESFVQFRVEGERAESSGR
jgi:hypothetical protein